MFSLSHTSKVSTCQDIPILFIHCSYGFACLRKLLSPPGLEKRSINCHSLDGHTSSRMYYSLHLNCNNVLTVVHNVFRPKKITDTQPALVV